MGKKCVEVISKQIMKVDSMNDQQLGLNPKSNHYPMIDILRGFAAFTVIVYHVIEHISWKSFPLKGIVGDWFQIGWMSVDLFFVTSGFVIVLSTVKSFKRTDSVRDFQKGYIRRRLTRIIPLHFLSCVIYLIFVSPEMLFMPRIGYHLISHIFFFHNWHPATIGSINGPNWSLGVEMQFYLIVMLAAGWLSQVRPWVLVMTCALISWSWRASAYAIFHDQIRFGSNLTWVYTSQVFGMLDLFAWGGALALLIANDTTCKTQMWLNRWWIWPCISLAAAIPIMKIYWSNASYWNIPAMVIFWRTSEGFLWACLLATACGMGSGRISRISLPFRYFGTISYGLYLWHIPVLFSLKRTYIVNKPESFLVWTLFLTFLCASASWHLFEKPLMEKYQKRIHPS